MASKRKAKLVGPAQYTPVEAVVLAIDPSKKCSGYGLLVPEYSEEDDAEDVFTNSYEVAAFGTVAERDQASRRSIVEQAAGAADDLALPLVVVAEGWSAGGFRMTYTSYVGLGEGWGLWRAELLACNIPDHCVLRPLPQQWRGRILGGLGGRDRASLKRTAKQYVLDTALVPYAVSDDVADALCIARWGTFSEEARGVAEKERRRFKRQKLDSYLEYDEEEDDEEGDDE